jgi:transcriptional regulator with XRE-family HTH domain
VATKREPKVTELGQFMRKWRKEQNLTVQEAADSIGVSKSTWSEQEHGQRSISIETLMALSDQTGVPLDALSRMAGLDVRKSVPIEDRARRVAALAEAIPRIGAVLDLLPELSGGDIDAMVSLAESLVARRKRRTEIE